MKYRKKKSGSSPQFERLPKGTYEAFTPRAHAIVSGYAGTFGHCYYLNLAINHSKRNLTIRDLEDIIRVCTEAHHWIASHSPAWYASSQMQPIKTLIRRSTNTVRPVVDPQLERILDL